MATWNGERFTIDGGEKLVRLLRELPPRSERKYLQKSLRAGMKIVRAATKPLVPVDKGLLKKSLAVRAAKRRKGRVMFRLTFTKGYQKQKKFYAVFVEFGHRIGTAPKGFSSRRAHVRELVRAHDSRGKVEGKAFMKRGFARARAGATAAVLETLREQLEAAPREVAA